MDKLSKSAHDKWTRCHWYPNDLASLATRLKAEDGDIPSGLKKGQEVVYLSADSEEELTELKEGEVYVIGGLVDRNRHKVSILRGSCRDIAEDSY
jgi:tRNA (guanine9-N1)-methyltransferase